jgi:hypothetical protein
MKIFIVSFVLGAAVGCFLTIQYQQPINQGVSQVNHTSNQMTAKVSEVKKAITSNSK